MRTLLVAGLVLGLTFVGGAWGLWNYFGGGWKGALSQIFLVVGLIYSSGVLSISLINLLVMLFGSETSLLRAVRGSQASRLGRASWTHYRREYGCMFVSVVVSLFVWMLFLLPWFLPVGVLIFAWAMGSEAGAWADRLSAQAGQSSLAAQNAKLSGPCAMGMAVVPAVCSLFPVVGWSLLPLLKIAALIGVEDLTQKS